MIELSDILLMEKLKLQERIDELEANELKYIAELERDKAALNFYAERFLELEELVNSFLDGE